MSEGVEGVENGEFVKGHTMRSQVYQAGKCDLGAEGNGVALKSWNKKTSKSDVCFQNI